MKTKGYTLIELLLVVVLLAFLSAFVVPTYQLILAQLQLSTATNQVADFIRLTEQKTVAEQQIYGVTLTNGASTIVQFLYNPVNSQKTTITTMTLPSDITIGSVNFANNSDIRFSTAGSPNVSGNLVLHDIVRNKNRQIDVRPSGGIFNNQPEY